MKCSICSRRINPGMPRGGSCRCKLSLKLEQIQNRHSSSRHAGKPERRERKKARISQSQMAGLAAILGVAEGQG